MFRWIVVLRGRQHIDEFLRASEDDLSFSEATNDVSGRFLRFERLVLKRRWQLFGRNLIFPREPHYHFNVIRSQLTRSLGTMCPTLREEIVTAFNEVLDLKGNGEHGFDVNCCAFTSEILRVAKYTCPGCCAKNRLQNNQQGVRWPSIVYFLSCPRVLYFYLLIT